MNKQLDNEIREFLRSKGIDDFIFITENDERYSILSRVYPDTFLFVLARSIRKIFKIR